MVNKSGFQNAQEMHKLHPDTFWCPGNEELDRIEVGGYVKVATDNDFAERFWVHVTHVEGAFITGTVHNDLVRTQFHGWKFGDTLKVHRNNVYDVMED